jgi:hypothetical protein
MMRIRLKDGPFDGQSEDTDDASGQFSTRVAGRRIDYKDSGKTDPADGLRIFVYDTKWRGIEADPRPDPIHPHRYRVVFMARRLGHARGPDGEYPRAPREASVIVEGEHELRVIGYDPPEDPLPRLTRKDWEGKALEAVRERIMRS